MKYAVIPLLAFAASIFLFPISAIPEMLLIVLYITISIQSLRLCKRTQCRWLVILACSVAIILHLVGFKFFGKPVLANLESLHNPRRAVGVEPPNIVLLADGTSTPMPDVFVPKKVDFRVGETNNYGVFIDKAGIHRALCLRIDQQQWPEVEIATAASDTVSLTCLSRPMYGCGNTWFPHFFPRRLPMMTREDFRVTLITAGVALPRAQHIATANMFWDPLIRALEQAWFLNLPPEHPQVVELGISLLDNGHFERGVELLIECKATNSLVQVKARLEDVQSGRSPLPSYFEQANIPDLIKRIDLALVPAKKQ